MSTSPLPRVEPAPELQAFLDAVDREMTAIVAEAAALQRVAVPDAAWRGGKKVRPRLVFECCVGLGAPPEDAVTLAAVTELIHVASLAHDDVIDDAVVRRGRPSLRATVGNRTAVLLGDLIFSGAWSRAVRELPRPAVSLLATAMTRMAGAEIEETQLQWDGDVEWSSCLGVIDGKTAALFAAAAGGSAVLAGAPAEAVQAVSACGEGVGRAFQVLDDVQDYAPLREGWGKERLKDLEQGIVTLPLVVALRNANGPAAFQLRRYLSSRGALPLDPHAVDALLAETGALAVCLRLAFQLCRRPLAAALPFLRADGLHRLVATLLAGLRDVPV